MPTTAPQSPLFVVVLVGIHVQTFVPSVPLLLLSEPSVWVRNVGMLSLCATVMELSSVVT